MLGLPHLNLQYVFNSRYVTSQTLPRETDLWQQVILSPNIRVIYFKGRLIFVAYMLNISFMEQFFTSNPFHSFKTYLKYHESYFDFHRTCNQIYRTVA